MASRSAMALLSFGRLRFCGVAVEKAVLRASYSIGLSVNSPPESKNFPSRSGRGALGRKPRRDVGEPRTQKMPVDQDWMSVYSAAKPFKAASVPLPVRMGYPVKGGVPPDKKGNLELIKIPNFLHLTPAAIRKHCEALKPFCTQWPSGLDSEEACDQHFPIKVQSTDYVSAGSSIRNPAARVVCLQVKLSSLNLDDHARKKLVKLVGERYCKDDNMLTITTDSCPLRQQNYDYALYLLTVLYHESWKTEAWEAEKTVADMEEYSWEDSPSQRNVVDLLLRMEASAEKNQDQARESLLERSEVQEYKDSVERLKNQGDSESSVLQYKEAVKKMLSL